MSYVCLSRVVVSSVCLSWVYCRVPSFDFQDVNLASFVEMLSLEYDIDKNDSNQCNVINCFKVSRFIKKMSSMQNQILWKQLEKFLWLSWHLE